MAPPTSKRRKLSDFLDSDGADRGAENSGDAGNAQSQSPHDVKRKIAKVSDNQNGSRDATNDGAPASFAEAMETLNKAFAAFVAAQLVLHPRGDFSEAAREYVAYVSALRIQYEVDPPTPVVEQESDQGVSPAFAGSVPSMEPSVVDLPTDDLPPALPPPEVTTVSDASVPLPPDDDLSSATAYGSGGAAGMSAFAGSSAGFGFGGSSSSSSTSPFGFGASSGSQGQISGPASASPVLAPAFGFSSATTGSFGSPPRPSSSFGFSGSSPAPASSGFSGFLASANTFSSSSIWTDPALLRLKVDSTAIQQLDAVYSSPRSLVWRGMWQGTAPVALKRLAPARQSVADALVFATNIKAAASLSHPRIVALMGVEWTKVTEIQVATEFMARGDLRSLLDSVELAATLSWANFKCQVAIDIADALAYIHSPPGRVPVLALPSSRKVLLTDDARAKLSVVHGADLAQQRHSNAVRYMAPEVIMGGPASNAADMYAFGVLLCELDTTQPPYVDAVSPDGVKMEDELVAQQVVKGLLVPRASPQCPEEIRRVIAECTTPDPALRPTAAALAYTLRGMLKNDL